MRTPESETPEKLRGGFYTPHHIAFFLTQWAASTAQYALEPSAGDGAFLRALSRLSTPPREVTAVELDVVEARKAKTCFGDLKGKVLNQDYLDFTPQRLFDAVVGKKTMSQVIQENSVCSCVHVA